MEALAHPKSRGERNTPTLANRRRFTTAAFADEVQEDRAKSVTREIGELPSALRRAVSNANEERA